ncbi:glycosyltransferase [Empedobacter falsenii]
MIPKIIHYCWFGGNPLTESIKKNIETWKFFNLEYEIKEWNESNCNLTVNAFVREAYANKKWAFVSDYIRVQKVYEYGGFYLDTDMEVTSSFEDLLIYECVCGFEMLNKPFSAFFGARNKHVFVEDMLNYYERQKEFIQLPNTNIFSKLLIEKYNVNPLSDSFQLVKDNVAVFPSTAFSLDIPKNYVIHHFDGSWIETEQSFFKRYVNMYGILNQLVSAEKSKESINHLIYHNKIFTTEQILDKIPMKFIVQYMLSQLKNKILRRN